MTCNDCIKILQEAAPLIKDQYGVKSLILFGSTARGTNIENSDVDLFVEMPPKALLFVRLGNYLENLLGKSVDLVLKKRNLRPFLLQEIKRDGITIF